MSRFPSPISVFSRWPSVRNHWRKTLAAAAFTVLAACVSSGVVPSTDGEKVAAPSSRTVMEPRKKPRKPQTGAARPAADETVLLIKNVVPPVSDVYAEPISPDTLKRFPHLASLQGHVLVGSRSVQAIVAGIGPQAPDDPWQAGVIAFFEWRAGAWRRLVSLGELDLRHDATGGDFYFATGVDLGVDREAQRAFVSLVFATKGAGLRKVVNYRFDAQTGRLALLTSDLTDANAKPATTALPSAWQLRLRSPAAGAIAAPVAELGALEGSAYLVRHAGEDVGAVVGYRPMAVREVGTEVVVTTGASAKAPAAVATPDGKTLSEVPFVEGFEILIGRASAGQVVQRAAAVRTCLYGAKRPTTAMGDEARFEHAASCADPESTGAVSVSLPADDAGEAEVPQSVFVIGPDGRALAHTALFAGESVTVAVPAGLALSLADTQAGRALAGYAATPVAVASGATLAVTLPARTSGRVRLSKAEGSAADGHEAALVTVTRLDQGRGVASVIGTAAFDGGAQRVARNSFLVTRWPLELRLVTGGYAGSVAGGTADDPGCRFRMQVTEAKPKEYVCPPRAGSPAAKGPPVAFADMSGETPAAVAPTAMRAAAGLAWLGIIAGAQGASVDADDAGTPIEDGVIPMLRVEDLETRLALSYFPATDELATLWRESRESRAADRLSAFARFLRATDRGSDAGKTAGLLELGCPAAGTSLVDYAAVVQRLQPDAVRLFACGAGLGEQSEHLLMLGRLTAARGVPVLVTSASALSGLRDFAGASPTLPRLATFAPDARDAPGFLTALRAGRFSVASGAWIQLLEAKWDFATPGTLALKIEMAPLSGRNPSQLFVYTEAGLLLQVPLPAEALGAMNARAQRTLRVTPPRGARFVRVEVRGDDEILASTNFQTFQPERP